MKLATLVFVGRVRNVVTRYLARTPHSTQRTMDDTVHKKKEKGNGKCKQIKRQ